MYKPVYMYDCVEIKMSPPCRGFQRDPCHPQTLAESRGGRWSSNNLTDSILHFGRAGSDCPPLWVWWRWLHRVNITRVRYFCLLRWRPHSFLWKVLSGGLVGSRLNAPHQGMERWRVFVIKVIDGSRDRTIMEIILLKIVTKGWSGQLKFKNN